MFPSLPPKRLQHWVRTARPWDGEQPTCQRLCFRDMDSSGGRGKHKLSDGNISGIEPLLISHLRSDPPDSNRQLDLKCQGGTKVPRLTYLTWKSLHGSRHQSGSGTSSRQVEHSGGLVQQSDQASSNRVGSQLSRFQSHHSKMGGARIHLFATRLNKQLLIYVSPFPDPQAFDTDALSMDWDILPFSNLFPPSPILPVML